MRLAVITLLLLASPGFATSFARPQRHDVFSRNRAFVLDVDPETKVHTVYDVRDRGKPLWSFSCAVWHFPFLLSDGGKVVATVGWRYVREEDIEEADAVTFWDKGGAFRTYALRELCPDPPKTKYVGGGPIGDFWRTWYTEVNDDGDSFTLRTTCGVEYRFRYADGELVGRRRVGLRGWGGPALAAGVVVGGAVVLALWWRRRRRRSETGSPLATAAPTPPGAGEKWGGGPWPRGGEDAYRRPPEVRPGGDA